jgi:hypothetical protein
MADPWKGRMALESPYVFLAQHSVSRLCSPRNPFEKTHSNAIARNRDLPPYTRLSFALYLPLG